MIFTSVEIEEVITFEGGLHKMLPTQLEELAAQYVTFPEIAKELNVSPYKAHNWAKHFHYFEKHHICGKPVVLKADYEKFKKERPDLKQQPRKPKRNLKNAGKTLQRTRK